MRRGTKIVLAGCAGLVVLMVIAGVLGVAAVAGIGRAILSDSRPERVAEVGNLIAGYDVPEGYVADYAVDVAGFAIAAYRPAERRGHLLIAQLPSWVETNTRELEREMRRAADDRSATARMRVEEVREVEVRGEPATLTVSRGRSSDGYEYMQLFGVFAGRNGTACVLAIDGVESYDQAALDAFVSSIE